MPGPRIRVLTPPEVRVDVVVKVGGSLLSHPEHFQEVLDTIGEAATARRILVVPGGGPFAELVRQVDRELTIDDSAAHWMAVLAMDQYAHLITSRLPAAALVVDERGVEGALARSEVPVLAVSAWLRLADPLPHSWDVTSDSIAAWVCGQVSARRLVLVKPPGVASTDAVDPYFRRVLPPEATSVVVPASQSQALWAALLA